MSKNFEKNMRFVISNHLINAKLAIERGIKSLKQENQEYRCCDIVPAFNISDLLDALSEIDKATVANDKQIFGED